MDTTWRQLINKEAMKYQDRIEDMSCTLTDAELDIEFDSGFGSSEGKPFTAWSHKRVYFPCTYDGAEYVRSAPREICDEATKHVGGQ